VTQARASLAELAGGADGDPERERAAVGLAILGSRTILHLGESNNTLPRGGNSIVAAGTMDHPRYHGSTIGCPHRLSMQARQQVQVELSPRDRRYGQLCGRAAGCLPQLSQAGWSGSSVEFCIILWVVMNIHSGNKPPLFPYLFPLQLVENRLFSLFTLISGGIHSRGVGAVSECKNYTVFTGVPFP